MHDHTPDEPVPQSGFPAPPDVEQVVWDWLLLLTNRLQSRIRRLEQAMSQNQDKINAIASQLDKIAADLTAEINALKTAAANGETLDFSALENKVATLGSLDTANQPTGTPANP